MCFFCILLLLAFVYILFEKLRWLDYIVSKQCSYLQEAIHLCKKGRYKSTLELKSNLSVAIQFSSVFISYLRLKSDFRGFGT